MSDVRPINPSWIVRVFQGWVWFTVHIPGLRWLLLTPVIARPGYWIATLVAVIWGTLLSLGRIRGDRGVIVARNCPRWAFGRGGSTIGAVYLTNDRLDDGVLAHESVHRAQWKHYGLAFIPLYIAAGVPAVTNRFEVDAGLERGGYL